MATISRDRTRKLKFFSSIRTKFALTYASLIAVVLILMNTYFLTASRDMIFASKQNFIEDKAAVIATSLSNDERLTVERVSQVMSLLDVTGLTHIIVTGIDGNSLYDTTNENDSTVNEFISDNIVKAMDGEGYDIFYSKFVNGAFSSSAFMPITNSEGIIIGSVYVHENDESQGEILVGMQNTLKYISIMIALLSIFMIVFVLWTIMHRITSILKAIKSVREGEYNYRVQMKGNDELALLGDEFNSLTDRIRETDEIRRRFVADASHELKTPLASIRLLSDSILQNEDMDIDTVHEFISDIGNESERLGRTTEKLMNLTRLDNKQYQDRSSVDIRSVISSTLRMLRPLAESRKLTLDSHLDGGCFVYSSEDEIYQIVFNLVENAIKYNVPEGNVTIRLTRQEAGIQLTVEDTGIGVPEVDLPYIFDRFYRVDKARSREAGGSGLGLSIVRATVRDNNGTIKAIRRNGGGMRFQVHFPLYIPPVES